MRNKMVFCFLLLLGACTTEKASYSPEPMYGCYQPGRGIQEEVLKPIFVQEIHPEYLITQNEDTTKLEKLQIKSDTDTIKFEELIKLTLLPEIIKELHIEGRMFYSFQITPGGQMDSLKVIRGLSSYDNQVTKELLRVLSGFTVVNTNLKFSKVIFSYRIRAI